MYNISDLILNYRENIDLNKTKVLNKRQEIIKMFVDRLNIERKADLPPLSGGFIASKMYQAGLKDDFDLWWFYGYCKDAQNFSATWWWALKVQKETSSSW